VFERDHDPPVLDPIALTIYEGDVHHGYLQTETLAADLRQYLTGDQAQTQSGGRLALATEDAGTAYVALAVGVGPRCLTVPACAQRLRQLLFLVFDGRAPLSADDTSYLCGPHVVHHRHVRNQSGVTALLRVLVRQHHLDAVDQDADADQVGVRRVHLLGDHDDRLLAAAHA
jgi:hypothetical protein